MNFGIGATYQIFGGLLSEDLKSSNTLTWTNKWSSTETSKVSQAATVSITGPAYGTGYSGPTLFNMYQDNIYGTYMFYPDWAHGSLAEGARFEPPPFRHL